MPLNESGVMLIEAARGFSRKVSAATLELRDRIALGCIPVACYAAEGCWLDLASSSEVSSGSVEGVGEKACKTEPRCGGRTRNGFAFCGIRRFLMSDWS